MKAAGVIIFIGIVASVAVIGIPQLRQEVTNLLTDSQCNKEVTYQLGAVDPKFGLSREKISQRIRAAANIWDKAWGKPLFLEDETGELTIDLVYDERAELNTKINQGETQLDQKDKTIKQQIATYQTEVANFKKKLADFYTRVERVNKAEEITLEEYNELLRQEAELRAESKRLNARANELNQSAVDFNSEVAKLNQDVAQFNQVLKLKPEEGIYSSKDNKITIFYAANPSDLVHTLAHEFGHVLEMDHISDPKGIMYPFVSETIELTNQDKAQLDYVCREQWIWELWIKDLRQRNLSKLSG